MLRRKLCFGNSSTDLLSTVELEGVELLNLLGVGGGDSVGSAC